MDGLFVTSDVCEISHALELLQLDVFERRDAGYKNL